MSLLRHSKFKGNWASSLCFHLSNIIEYWEVSCADILSKGKDITKLTDKVKHHDGFPWGRVKMD